MKTSILLLLFLILITFHVQTSDTTLLVIKGATFLDVRTGQQIKNSVIVIEKDRIKEIGTASNIVIPTNAS